MRGVEREAKQSELKKDNRLRKMGSNDLPTKLLSEAFGPPLSGPKLIVYDMLLEAAIKNPDKVALVCMHQSPSLCASITKISTSSEAPYLRWTYSQLRNASHFLAASLYAAGIRPGMSVMAFVNNCAEFHVLWWAARELNCPFATFLPRVASSKEEARHLLEMISPSVILAQEATVVEKLEAIAPETMGSVKIKLFSPSSTEETVPKHWFDLEAFTTGGLEKSLKELESVQIERRLEDVILILTTSGTTSLPKGCAHTNFTICSFIQSFIANEEPSPSDASLVHIPVAYSFGLLYAIAFFTSGLKVVHPSYLFSPGSSLAAIREERCSHTPGVPAMFQAMLYHPEFKREEMGSMKHVLVAAAIILPEMITMIVRDLGAKKCSEGFGMTEAGPAILQPYRYAQPPFGTKSTCGYPTAGFKVRISKLGTQEVLPRGVPGELQLGGDGVISSYMLGKDKKSSEAFYKDHEGLWVMSGDQAVMHESGEVSIVGRYKDIIKRGGVNISPSAIETLLLGRFGVVAEVVGLADEIVGEIPIAVIKRNKGQEVDIPKIREELVKELGPTWVPEEIIDIETLGMNDFPRTSTGKVQKRTLRKILAESRQATNAIRSISSSTMLDTLTQIWTKLLSLSPGALQPETSILDWADSLILARFSSILHREAGLQISLAELMQNPTLQAQASLLSSRSSSSPSSALADISPARHGPPEMGDMIHTFSVPDRYSKTKTMVSETVAPLGLSWNDVEDVIPMNGVQEWFLKKRRPQSSNHRHAWLCPGSTPATLQTAVEKALSHHPMLRSMAVYFDTETSLHIVIRPSPAWFANCITHVPSISNTDELADLVYNDPLLDHAAFPGPLIRFVITHVEETNCAGLVYQAQHSIFDAVSLPMFLEDVSILIGDPSAAIKPRVSYKAWADNFYALQDSLLARTSLEWQVKRLHGISAHPGALFPRQRAPEWFKGSSHNWIDVSTGLPGPARAALDENPIGAKGLILRGQLRDVQALKMRYSIEASQIVKAALAVLTTRSTGEGFALFGQYQAGRTWPFLLDWMVERMPPAMDINGPCVQGSLNKIPIQPNETILSVLARLQDEQQLLNKHAFAPRRQLVEALNAGTSTETGMKDGEVMVDAFKRQIFNWLPTAPEFSYSHLKKIQLESRTDCGLLWNCIMIDQTTLQIHATWDDAQLSKKEIEEMLGELMRISEAFAKEENWKKTVSTIC